MRIPPVDYLADLKIQSYNEGLSKEDLKTHLNHIVKWKTNSTMRLMYVAGIEILLNHSPSNSDLFRECLDSPLLSLRYIQANKGKIQSDRLKKLETSISLSGMNSLNYSSYIKKRFELGEPAILKHSFAKPSYITLLKTLTE